jgi:hypothetical protein
MAAKFEVSFPKTMRVEGACNFSSHDKGNIVVNGVCTVPTYAGIAPAFHYGWRGFAYVKDIAASMKNRPPYDTPEFWRWKRLLDKTLADSPVVQNLVKTFYKANFWDNYRLGEITAQEVADWLFDHAVNAGGRGIKWAQLAANVKPDGGIGPITLAAINKMDPKEFLARAADIAGKHRLDVANGNPSQIPFLTSWLSRDGQPAEIIAMVKAAAKDGRIDEREEVDLNAAMARC